MTTFGVIGASGFVGRHLTRELSQRGHAVRAIVRSPGTAPRHCDEMALGDFTDQLDWDAALKGLDTIICLAARVHVMHETEADPLAAFRKINVEVTGRIAQAAARVGAKRLIFLSSIKVNGDNTLPGTPYRASDTPKPTDPYGMSKLEAENVLRDTTKESGLEIAIIRPPLVYGPGVGGNFLKLLKLAGSGIPLPFGSVKNARAMIAVDNLVDAIVHCSMASLDGPTLVLVNDKESLSTPALLRMLSDTMSAPSRLLPFPPSLLYAFLAIARKKSVADRLIGSLDVEISSDPPGFTWLPPHSTKECLKSTVSWFVECPGMRK